MSKKRKTQQKQENLLQSVAALTANGLKAFCQKEFEKAISTWGKIPVKLRPAALLAEGYFRHGLALFYGQIISDRFSTLIRRNTAIPTSREEIFYAMHSEQDTIEIEVYQGEHSFASHNTPLGSFLVTDLKSPAPNARQLVKPWLSRKNCSFTRLRRFWKIVTTIWCILAKVCACQSQALCRRSGSNELRQWLPI